MQKHVPPYNISHISFISLILSKALKFPTGPNPTKFFFLSISLIKIYFYINVCNYQKLNHFQKTKIYQSR